MDYRTVLLFSTLALVIALFRTSAEPQQLSNHDFKKVTITLKSEGGPCGCVYLDDNDRSCCPAFSVSIDENGTVIYEGQGGVKVRGERVHSIPLRRVKDLVAEFYKTDFFSLQDRYTQKKLANGRFEEVDHANATTVSISIDGKIKSIYVFYGAPQGLIDLQRTIVETSEIGQYLGRA